jgi:hypothetical protein
VDASIELNLLNHTDITIDIAHFIQVKLFANIKKIRKLSQKIKKNKKMNNIVPQINWK